MTVPPPSRSPGCLISHSPLWCTKNRSPPHNTLGFIKKKRPPLHFRHFRERGLGSKPTCDKRSGHRPRLEPETRNGFGTQHKQGRSSSPRHTRTVRRVSYSIFFPPNGIRSHESLHDRRLRSPGQALSRLRIAGQGVTRDARKRRSS